MIEKDCIFCQILEKKISGHIVYQDELVTAFLDIQPLNDGHVLIIPNTHFKLISDVDDEAAARMFNVARIINSAIRRSTIKSEGLNFWLADGETAFQDVFHTHLHCFPRYKNDGFGLKLPENYRDLPSQEKLDQIALEIKRCL